MSLLSYLFPRVIARYSSPYNRDIRVLEENGKNKLLVNGSRQSGEYVQKLWQHAFCAFGIIPSPDVRSILVLGVGGGTVIHLLSALYPDALITGVDIDEKMVSIGKKYFGLTGFSLEVEDAQKFVKRAGWWDMIVVDLFIGATIPYFVGEEVFFRHLRRLMTPKGMVVINYLRELQYLALSKLMREKLQKIFRSVHETDINFNRFFMVK